MEETSGDPRKMTVMWILRKTKGSILLRATINVYTDHKNLMHHLSSSLSQRAMQWGLLLEEYGASFSYHKGEHNVLTDALSHVASFSERKSPPGCNSNNLCSFVLVLLTG